MKTIDKNRKIDSFSSLFRGEEDIFKKYIPHVKIYGEYGCGQSTVYVCMHTKARIISVDTNKDWIERVKASIEDTSKVELIHVDLGPVREWGYPGSLSHSKDFINYSNSIWRRDKKICGVPLFKHKPDFILIDGRFRVCAFLTSLINAKKGTLILFDDYLNRPHYHVVEQFIKPIELGKTQALFKVGSRNLLLRQRIKKMIKQYANVLE